MKTNDLSNYYKSRLKRYSSKHKNLYFQHFFFFLGSTVINIESEATGMKTTYIIHNIIYFKMSKNSSSMARKSNRIFHSNNV
jgi:hypothetical protein